MSGVGHLNCSEATVRTFILVQLQFIHSLEVECQTTSAAIDLEAIEVLTSSCVACCFNCANCSLLEPHYGKRGVVYIDARHFVRSKCGPFTYNWFEQSSG